MKYCPDCTSTHMGIVPCGGRKVRWKSVLLDGSVTPTQSKRIYYDDAAVSEQFGGYDRKERRELYQDDTKGLGSITSKNPDPKHVETILGKDE